ncbi:MAG TPA: transposase [Telluria sp.]|nr:transposase [Telluria sp.]
MKKNAIAKSRLEAGADVAVPGKRAKISNEFKHMAVQRMREGIISQTALAVELGIKRNQLYKWAKVLGDQLPGESFKNPGRPVAGEETEVEQLRRKLTAAEEELAILKKFDAYLTRRKQ